MSEHLDGDQKTQVSLRLLPALTQQGQQALPLAPVQGELYLPRCPAWVYVRSLAKGGSQRTMASALRTLVQIIFPDLSLEEDTIYRFPWGQLRYEHTSILRSELADRYDFTTANKHLSALRQVLKHAWLLKLMDVEDYMRAISIKDIRGTKEPSGRLVTGEEFARMIQTCLGDLKPQGVRDLVLLVVLYVTGLRRSELSKLNYEDYTPSNHALRIRGKGNKGRTVYVNADGAAAALDMWLEMRGREAGPLFCPIDRWGHVRRVGEKVRRKNHVDSRPLARLTPEGIYDVFMDRARAVLTEEEKAEGKEPARPHDVRRTMISTYFESGVDIAIMRRLTGHVKTDTLVGYDRRPAGAAEKAAKVIVLPGALRALAGEQEEK
jgi:site-specific recombinase XerD